MKTVLAGFLVLVAFVIATFVNPNLWFSPDQRGEALMRDKDFAKAAKTFGDPWRAGVALYRNGDFQTAAKMFARVPGAEGVYNQANAWLMHGDYDHAIASYTQALTLRPGWREAEENRALAKARKQSIADAGKSREEEAADAYEPDQIVSDGNNKRENPDTTQGDGNQSDDALRQQWLRKVQTTPGDFLKAKFAWQARQAEANP